MKKYQMPVTNEETLLEDIILMDNDATSPIQPSPHDLAPRVQHGV